MAPVKKPFATLGRTFLKDWREHCGLNQEEAAARLNVSRTLLSKVERAQSPYTQRLLEAAAKVYGCTPADLLVRSPSDADSLWDLFARAQKREGEERRRIRQLILIGLGEA